MTSIRNTPKTRLALVGGVVLAALLVLAAGFVGLGSSNQSSDSKANAAPPPQVADDGANAVAVVSDDGQVSFPPAVVAEVNRVTAAFDKCFLAQGGRIVPVEGGFRYDGDTSKCRSEQAAASAVNNSALMRAADRSRNSAAQALTGCVASETGGDVTAVGPQVMKGGFNPAAIRECVAQARQVAVESAHP
jgi:hypothetical protein